jgi:hypothetical protein
MSLPLLPLVLDAAPDGLRRALAQEGVPAVERSEAPRAGRFVLVDRPMRPAPLVDGQTAIDVDKLRTGFGFDPFEALVDERAARRGWRVGPLVAGEEVARYDKRAVRRLVLDWLRGLVEAAGGVWMRLGPWPWPHTSAFNFRLDHDAFASQDFHAVLDALAGYEGATTHYVCAATHEGHAAALARLRGLDVGGHGYWHHTYRDAAENRRNIARGMDSLVRLGIEPCGFAAPHGRWPSGLGAVLEELGVSHSSEFGLAWDDWPCRPPQGGPVQVPVHPVCEGVVLEAARMYEGPAAIGPRAAASWLADHFRSVIDARHRAGEPAFLYGHPDDRLGRFPEVLRGALAHAASLAGMWNASHSEVARWWNARGQVRWRVEADGEALVVQAESALSAAEHLTLEHWRGGTVARVPLEGPVVRLRPAALVYRERPAPAACRAELLPCREGLRGQVLRQIDWEHVTPTHEIARRGWRGWAKRTLRGARDRMRSP